MASEEDHHVYNDDDLDDDEDEDSEPLNGAAPYYYDAVACDSDSSSDTDVRNPNSTAVTVAIPASIATPVSTVTVALPDPKRHRIDSSSSPLITSDKKPIDDSRRLFQRLWTDEDEIELLQGFLEYTMSRGTTSSGHHLDTAAFYDQIKSKLQLEFNKNQLVEKLRRLKKKYRNVVSRMGSGKDFSFKSPHDQLTFEISKKIWSNSPVNHRAVEFDDDDQNQNPNPNPSPIAVATPNRNHIYSSINLNNAATALERHKASSSTSNNNTVNFDMMFSNLNNSAAAAKLSSRKRPRVGKIEEKLVRNVNLGGNNEGFNINDNYHNNNNNGGDNKNNSYITTTTDNNNSNITTTNNNSNSNHNNAGSSMQGLIEETVRSCLSPLFKELINNAMNGHVMGGVGGVKGVGALATNAIPLNFPGGNWKTMDEKWRKQQILELEVYSKRLELVQDHIKSTLDELRSMGS